MRHYSFVDQLIVGCDRTLRANTGVNRMHRPSPAAHIPEQNLNPKDHKHSCSLMRVNHAGEICAQALYQGQALVARSNHIQKKLQQAAQEENDHLYWCHLRLIELNTHPSYLCSVWYGGAWVLGIIAGLFGDKLNLGFLAETEYQVERHLGKHLNSLPLNDKKSRAIVAQMRLEEIEHAETAESSGASTLPVLIQWSMQGLAKFMTTIAYWI
jgi:3-demethoxyubiquinol 3-hydroxylase